MSDVRVDRPLRVTHVLGSFGPGGAEMGVVRLIESFPDPRVTHSVVVIRSDLTLAPLLPVGVSVHSLNLAGRGPTAALSLARRFRTLRTDVAHVNNLAPWADVAIASRMIGCRCIETFHGVEDGRQAFPATKRLLYRSAHWLSAATTAVAPAAGDLLSQLTGVAREGVRVIENGVDMGQFRPPGDPGERAALRGALGLPAEAVLLGCVAALRPVKNHAGLIQAFSVIANSAGLGGALAAARLVLIGDGPLRVDLEGCCRELGVADRVLFLGRRDDVPDVLRALDAFVLNSDTEGLSYAVLEAMASGLPAVLTRVGANGEIVREGVEGFLVPPSDPEAMASRLKTMVESPDRRRPMGEAARRRVAARYSLDAMVGKYADLYGEVI